MHGSRADQRGYDTVVAVIDVGGVAVAQPLERTGNVDVELKVVLVLGLVDSLEVADDIFMDVGSEWLRGLDLVVGGCVEVKDPSGSHDRLIKRSIRGE
jgi:hypothetical protein